MLRLTVEIIPFGDETLKETIDTMEITNTGKNKRHPKFGDYKWEVFGGDVQGKGEIAHFERSSGHWELIKKVIEAI